ncbi:Peroxin 13, N-terminal region-domain-containing protein [Syncephalis fuscata]|nr:Peroxin 13, N-terminal region-domain-containing protein [Syncephalis fuscata]
MPSPPKPWERAGGGGGESITATAAGGANSLAAATNGMSAASPITGSASVPSLPARNATTGYTGATGVNTMNRPGYGAGYGSGYNSGYGTGYNSGYGSSYGTGLSSGYSSYSSPYNRYGASRYGTGGLYGSSYGGMSSYGNYGTAYGSYGGYGGGLYGPRAGMYGMGMQGGDPNDPSLMNRMEQNTASTFHLLESVVGAFGGFAQMLESTYMATHSSFMAMIGVAEQFGHLRNYLGQVLSVFALLRALKRLGYWIIGRQPPVDPLAINVNEFESHSQQRSVSRRPILFFLAAIIGIPWLINRLIRAADRRRQDQGGNGGDDASNNSNNQLTNGSGFNPNELEFARALYDFQGDHAAELNLQRGDLIAILSRHDAQGQPSQWWRGRLRDGRIGLFPANYVEILEKRSNNDSNNNNSHANHPAGGDAGQGGPPSLLIPMSLLTS